MSTSIEWTDETWNPLRGCRRISPGCEHCYAERQAARPILSGPGLPYAGLVQFGRQGPRWTGATAGPDQLDVPLRWKKPRKVFPCSMSDLFFERFTDEEIAAVFGTMARAWWHTFQILTKRPERALKWFRWFGGHGVMPGWGMSMRGGSGVYAAALPAAQALRGSDFTVPRGPKGRGETMIRPGWPLPNVWIGTSVEDQQRADERLPHLLQIPAAVRFVSYEPALGPVNWHSALCAHGHIDGSHPEQLWSDAICEPRRPGIDWIIVGGESGPGARPFDLAWARSTIQQARAAGVKVFVKQLGAVPHLGDCRSEEGAELDRQGRLRGDFLGREASARIVLRDRKGADPAEWPEDLRVQEWPEARP